MPPGPTRRCTAHIVKAHSCGMQCTAARFPDQERVVRARQRRTREIEVEGDPALRTCRICWSDTPERPGWSTRVTEAHAAFFPAADGPARQHG